MGTKENQLIENIIPILKNLEKEIPINLEVYGNTLKKIEKTASPINNIKKTKKALFSRYLFGTFYRQEIQSLFLSCVEGDLNVNEIMEYSSQKKEKELEHKIAFNKDGNLRKELFFDNDKIELPEEFSFKKEDFKDNEVEYLIELIIDIYCVLFIKKEKFDLEYFKFIVNRYNIHLRSSNARIQQKNTSLNYFPTSAENIERDIASFFSFFKEFNVDNPLIKASVTHLFFSIVSPFSQYGLIFARMFFLKVLLEEEEIYKIKYLPILKSLQAQGSKLSKILNSITYSNYSLLLQKNEKKEFKTAVNNWIRSDFNSLVVCSSNLKYTMHNLLVSFGGEKKYVRIKEYQEAIDN